MADTPKMTKWIPESDPMILRRVGKTGEECAELSKVCSRITIQAWMAWTRQPAKPTAPHWRRRSLT